MTLPKVDDRTASPPTALFLRETWYLAGWRAELDDGPLARTIADVPLLFFAHEDRVAALLDRCPHRFAPLSCGKVAAGTVTCAYHGLAFGSDGRCVHNPHGPVVAALAVPAYPVEVRHEGLWVWLGTPERADPALIPDLGFIDRVAPEARVIGHLENDAHYLLMVENIMDLSHADYLHPTTLGNGINTRTKGKVEVAGDAITIRWHADNEILPPAQNAFLPEPGQRADFRNEVRWQSPGVMVQRLLFGPTGRLSEEGADSRTAHVMTPLSGTRTHYFFCHTSDTVSRNPALVPVVRDMLLSAFAGEDAPMLAAQQSRIGSRDFWSLKPVMLPIDAGAVRVRRRMDELLAQESARENAGTGVG